MTTIFDSLTTGDVFEVTDALGRSFRKRAVSAVENGGAYPVIWACSEAEWDAAEREGREPNPDPFPWPLKDAHIGAMSV